MSDSDSRDITGKLLEAVSRCSRTLSVLLPYRIGFVILLYDNQGRAPGVAVGSSGCVGSTCAVLQAAAANVAAAQFTEADGVRVASTGGAN
jgi:hypothetical protein